METQVNGNKHFNYIPHLQGKNVTACGYLIAIKT